MKTLKEKIAVMQAALDGKDIEYADSGWDPIETKDIIWDWYNVDYRVKPEPIEFWINIRESGVFDVCSSESKALSIKDRKVVKTIKVREVISGD